ncbi:beta-1,3-galactosyltransferase 1-like [Branchiostoma lanceolatum]|uniref:beta-1,3-galactosyltransferase 1-like n=1 Tax=Branchiostoma lanceolatum TaxID=7740 RepID=UPI003453EDCC
MYQRTVEEPGLNMLRTNVRLTLKILVIIAGLICINWLQQSLHRILHLHDSRRSTSGELEVINPHPYTFIINNPDECKGSDVFLLVIVTSGPENHGLRYAIRHTWGNESNVPGTVIKTLFAVGKPDNALIQQGLERENDVYKDIIQEDFIDSYNNLTVKTVMCLKWASEFCPYAKFVLKADDDTLVNIYCLVRRLRELNSTMTKRFVTGRVHSVAMPHRSLGHRWYVSRDDYPRPTFPKYPAGFAYVISNGITGLIYEVSLTLNYLPLEDVFLGLCLEKLRVDPLNDNRFHPWSCSSSCETERGRLASHWVKTHDAMVEAWHTITIC